MPSERAGYNAQCTICSVQVPLPTSSVPNLDLIRLGKVVPCTWELDYKEENDASRVCKTASHRESAPSHTSTNAGLSCVAEVYHVPSDAP